MAVQWLRLCASSAGVVGLILGQGTKIPHAAQCSQNNNNNNNNYASGPPECHSSLTTNWLSPFSWVNCLSSLCLSFPIYKKWIASNSCGKIQIYYKLLEICPVQCKLSVNNSSYRIFTFTQSGRSPLRVISLELSVRQDSEWHKTAWSGEIDV